MNATTLERSAAQASRPILSDLDLPLGKRTRLRRLLYETVSATARCSSCPSIRAIEHGPVDFFPNPASKDPEFQWRLAAEGGYNAIACHWGLARMYMASMRAVCRSSSS